MNKLEIQKRKDEMTVELDGECTNEKVEELRSELKTLDTELGEIEMREKKQALADSLMKGEVESKEIIKEERKMETVNVLESKEYRSGYFKALQGKELTVEERTAVSGQSVIPTVTMNKIVEKLEQTSVLYNRITVSNFPNKLSIPRENAKGDASWNPIATVSTDSADSFDYVSLVAWKLIKTIEIESDVQAMSIDVFEAFIVAALVKKMNKAIENAILNGTGSSQPTGLLYAGEVTNTGTYTKAGMTFSDLMTILGSLPTMYHTNATLIMTRTVFFNQINGMLDANGRPIVVFDPTSPSKFSVLGYPVIIDDLMTTDYILFGDLSYYYFNWAKGIEIMNDKSVSFRYGNIVYRAMALADGRLTLAEAFTKYTRAS